MKGRRARMLDRALVGRAAIADARRLAPLLRDDPGLRAAYDRGALAMRTLERAAVSEIELDWVERRLEADGILAGDPAPAPGRAWAGAWWLGATALLAAALAVLALRPAPPPPQQDDPMRARGLADPSAGWFAISVLCDRDATMTLTDVADARCDIDATLTFAVRVDARHRGGEHLALFGVDDGGDVQYYLPTPDDAAPPVITRERWTALDRAVRLWVNHRPGRVRVYAALLPHPPSLAAIDAAAATLARSDSAGDEIPWLSRLGPAHPLLADCDVARCLGAELEFHIEGRTQ